LFFYGLNAGELWRTEGLRAIIAQEMLRSGNWIVPTLYGEPLFTKPPGMYVAIALASWPFGGVTEWTARLPSALAATATVFLFYWYFSRQLGRTAGFWAALMLPMSPMWLDKAPSAEIDMLQVFWVTTSILFLFRALDGMEARSASEGGDLPSSPALRAHNSFLWWLLALLCVAGGVLTKWTAPAFFYLTAIPLLWQRRQLGVLLGWQHLISAALAAALCLSWAIAAVALSDWDIFHTTILREAFYRLVPNYAEDPYRWDETLLHPLRILITTLPWSVVALWTLRPGFARNFDIRGQRLLQGLHCWLWPNLLFFSLLTEHTPRHSFPFFPAIAGLAVMAACSFQRGAVGRRWPRLPGRTLAAWVIVWLILKVLFVEALVPHRNGNRDPRAKGELIASLVPSDTMLYLLKLKDEGIMFYCNRPIRRLQSTLELPRSYRNVYCILTENEFDAWHVVFNMNVIQRLRDQQGDGIVLVQIPPHQRPEER